MASKTLENASTVSHRFAEQTIDPSNPAAGFWKSFFKSDGLYIIDDTGVVSGPMISADTGIVKSPTSIDANTIQPSAGDYVALALKPMAVTGTENILNIYNASDTLITEVDSNGLLTMTVNNSTASKLDIITIENNHNNTSSPGTSLLINQSFNPTGENAYNATGISLGMEYNSSFNGNGNLFGISSVFDNTSSGGIYAYNFNAVCNNTGTATLPWAAGYYVSPFTNTGGGTIDGAYGYYCEDINVATENYSIYTNAGDVVINGGNAAGNVTIGGEPISVNYDLAIIGDGVLMMKETTTPTPDTNYGKVYCKNDNKLYFQDGAGIEHEIAFV